MFVAISFWPHLGSAFRIVERVTELLAHPIYRGGWIVLEHLDKLNTEAGRMMASPPDADAERQ
jgi:hypothetical protein